MRNEKKIFGIGIIGCGVIGQKRAKALGVGGHLVACADKDINRAKFTASTSNASAFEDWKVLLKVPEVEIVVIATLHDSLAQISLAAIKAGKHVLVEKPAARNTKELEPVILAAKQKSVKIHVGFNHRYHRSLRKARELIETDMNQTQRLCV
jgi:predicted dehydrogenase